jgi:aspartyl-tRNA(Asn)/glutamyl-tRNA(Gln) amidotransferase subunit A
MNDLFKLTLKQAAEGLKKKEFSSKELTTSFFDRVKKIEPKIDAFLLLTEELALEQAEKADKILTDNQNIGELIGVPFGLKDIIVTKNIRTTAGSKILSDFIPPYSATVYEKLEQNHSVMVGKTNLDEFAMGASTENSGYKITKNPWSTDRVPGGSSGGSAAAVSADMATYAIGSDTGGSIRQPASFCGVVGLKPTYGRVSRYGLIAMASSLDQIGPITKSVEDAAIVLKAISGSDKYDATSVEKEVPDYTQSLKGDIKELKIGVPKEFLDTGVDPKVRDVINKSIKQLEGLGAKLIELTLSHTKEAIAVYYLIMPSEVSANLARYDGIRFGKDREEFGSEVKRRIMLGTYALSSGYYDAYYLKAAKVRTLIREEFQEAFKKVDVIVGPTSPTLPFKIGDKVDDPLQMYLADILTVPINLAGLPAISIPCGLVDGLPVGLQIVGDHWQEGKILNTALAYEKSCPFKEKPKL